MISAEEFLDALEQKDVVAPGVLGQLRQVVARIDRPLTASWAAKWLVDNGHLAHRLAQWLLEQSAGQPKRASFRDVRFPWQRRPGEDLPGELLLGMLVREDLLSETDIRTLGARLAQGSVAVSAAEFAEQLAADGVLPRKMVDYLLARLVEKFARQPFGRPAGLEGCHGAERGEQSPSTAAGRPQLRDSSPSTSRQPAAAGAAELLSLLRAKDVLPSNVLDRIEFEWQDRCLSLSAEELAAELVDRRLLPRQLANYLLGRLGGQKAATPDGGRRAAVEESAKAAAPDARAAGRAEAVDRPEVGSQSSLLSAPAQTLAALLEQKGLIDRATMVRLADRVDRSAAPLSARAFGQLLVAEGLLTGKLLKHLLDRTAATKSDQPRK